MRYRKLTFKIEKIKNGLGGKDYWWSSVSYMNENTQASCERGYFGTGFFNILIRGLREYVKRLFI